MKTPRLFALVIALLASSSILSAQTPDPADGSRANLKALAGAVKAYGLLYGGKRPEKISALLEEGLVPGANVFAIPGHTVPARADVDAKGDYTLDPLPGGADLLVREKSALHTPGKVLAIFKDGSIRALDAPVGATSAPTAPTAVAAPAARSDPPPAAARVAPPAQPAAVAQPAASESGDTPPPVLAPPSQIASSPPRGQAPPAPALGAPVITTRGDVPPEVLAAFMQAINRAPGGAAVTTEKIDEGAVEFSRGAPSSGHRQLIEPAGDDVAKAAREVNDFSSSLPVRSAVDTPPESSSAPQKTAWQVTHQLVQGLPWPSAKWTEREILARVKEAEATPDQRLVEALNDLGGWQHGHGKLDEAEQTYRRVRGVQSNRGLENHYDYALVLNDLGVVLTEAKRDDEALKFFVKAQELWETRWDGPLPTEDYAVTLHNQAVLLANMNRGTEAAALEKKAGEVMAARRQAMGF